MTKEDHLLVCLVDESLELAQRATKALRFGLRDVQPGQQRTNAERVRYEFGHLVAVYDLLMKQSGLTAPDSVMLSEKKQKVAELLAYLESHGRVTTP